MVDKQDLKTSYLTGIKEELKKVTWPSRSEVIKLSFVVISISLIIAFYIGLLDVVFAKLLEFLTK